MEVYLVRHGESTHNAKKLYTGMTDAPLTEKGRQQARALRPLIKGIVFEGIYTSDLMRAHETCRLMVGEKARIVIDRDLREMSFGDFEGRPYENLEEAFGGGGEDRLTYRIPGGESIEDLYVRANRAYDGIIKSHQVGDQVLITAHGGTIRAILSKALEGSLEGYWQYPLDNATLTKLTYESAKTPPKLSVYNQRA